MGSCGAEPRAACMFSYTAQHMLIFLYQFCIRQIADGVYSVYVTSFTLESVSREAC